MPNKDRHIQLAHQRAHYQENKADYLARHRRRRVERREWFNLLLSTMACAKCGENDPVCLDFHHLNPNEKDQNVSKLFNDLRSKSRILDEISKCEVLCANCHRKVHAIEHQKHIRSVARRIKESRGPELPDLFNDDIV